MARHVKMMMLDTCPHCRHAFEMMDRLKAQYPEFAAVEIEMIEENREPEKTEGYDYWYVPTYFIEDIKVHEGIPTLSAVEAVFRRALE